MMKNRKMLTALGFPILAMSLFVFVSKVWGHELGRMTGGGSVFLTADDLVEGFQSGAGTRITHGFELHCGQVEPEFILPAEPNNLQINIHTPDGGDGRFHLEQLTHSQQSPTLCRSGVDPSPPQAPFYWYEGHGTGRYNGQPGYCADWEFTDEGEPGTKDRIYELHIYNCTGSTVVRIFPVLDPEVHTLTFGNHQAHRTPGQP